MSIQVKHLRSSAENSKPVASSLEHGILAVNYFKGKEQLFTKNTANEVATFSSDNILIPMINEKAKASDSVGKKTSDGGEIFNDYENNQSVKNAHAEGYGTKAIGEKSHAEGNGTTANGIASHAEGFQTIADGIYASHAEGYLTTASGFYSHSEGAETKANGECSHAEGRGSITIGLGSHAEGSGTTASGKASHSEGSGTTANGDCSHAEGEKTTANGYASHAEGRGTTASGFSSHAEGSGTTANGDCSHAEGEKTTASGFSSHAEGEKTTANGDCSHAEGSGTTASGFSSHAEGEKTTANGYASHAEGSGTTANGESSHAEGSGTTASGFSSHAEGNGTTASGYASHAEGSGTTANGESSHAEGSGTTASGFSSHAEGNGTTASGNYSHAEGKSITHGEYSHAEGKIDDPYRIIEKESYAYTKTVYVEGGFSSAGSMSQPMYSINTSSREVMLDVLHSNKINKNGVEYIITNTSGDYVVFDRYLEDTSGGDIRLYKLSIYTEQILREIGSIGVASHSEGHNSAAIGDYSHSEGDTTKANGKGSHAEGWKTIANGDNSHAEGSLATANGKASHAEGSGTTTTTDYEHAQGTYNLSTQHTTLSSIGIGKGDKERANVFEATYQGKVFVKGVGTYDGTNVTTATSLSDVYTEITSDISNKKDKTSIITFDDKKTTKTHDISPDKLYVIKNATNTTLNFIGNSASILSEYMIELQNCTVVKFPSGITWARPIPSQFNAKQKYNFSIVNNLGLWCEF